MKGMGVKDLLVGGILAVTSEPPAHTSLGLNLPEALRKSQCGTEQELGQIKLPTSVTSLKSSIDKSEGSSRLNIPVHTCSDGADSGTRILASPILHLSWG